MATNGDDSDSAAHWGVWLVNELGTPTKLETTAPALARVLQFFQHFSSGPQELEAAVLCRVRCFVANKVHD